MAYLIKMALQQYPCKIRDGKGIDRPMKTLSTTEFVRFENLPSADDPNLIIVEEVPTPAPKKKRSRKKKSDDVALAEKMYSGAVKEATS